MHATHLAGDIEARFAIKRFVLYTFAGSMVLNVILAAKVLTTENAYQIEIKVPPSLSKSFSIDERKLSNEYLETMGWYALQLAVNTSPASAERQVQELLKFVSPSSYGDVQKALLANAARLKDNNASTTFFPMEVVPNVADNSVVFRGLLSTWIADKRTSQVQKTFLVRFAYGGGRIFLKELREADPREPFKEVADGSK